MSIWFIILSIIYISFRPFCYPVMSHIHLNLKTKLFNSIQNNTNSITKKNIYIYVYYTTFNKDCILYFRHFDRTIILFTVNKIISLEEINVEQFNA